MLSDAGPRTPASAVLDPWAEPPPPRHEPIFSAPWPPIALVIGLLAVFALQGLGGDPLAAGDRFAFAPVDLLQPPLAWFRLVSAMVMHGSWSHVGFNSIFIVAFGTPVSRALGRSGLAALTFFALTLVCGVAGNLGFAFAHWGGAAPVIGASGAASGLMGAASRLVDQAAHRHDGADVVLAPFLSRTVIAMAASWIAVNLAAGFLGLNFGVPTGGQQIAWEAHLAGYAMGLILIAPTLALVGRLAPRG